MTRACRTAPRIGLTGGVATGKSAVAHHFTTCGAALIDADTIVHDLYAHSLALQEQLRRECGDAICTASGAIDRQQLATLVFADATVRRRVESIVHPLVWQAITDAEAAAQASQPPLVVCEIPLLYEAADPAYFDAVVVAACQPAEELRRVMARYQCDAAAASQRIAAQQPLAEKIARADYVVWTDGPPTTTAQLVATLYPTLLTRRM